LGLVYQQPHRKHPIALANPTATTTPLPEVLVKALGVPLSDLMFAAMPWCPLCLLAILKSPFTVRNYCRYPGYQERQPARGYGRLLVRHKAKPAKIHGHRIITVN